MAAKELFNSHPKKARSFNDVLTLMVLEEELSAENTTRKGKYSRINLSAARIELGKNMACGVAKTIEQSYAASSNQETPIFGSD